MEIELFYFDGCPNAVRLLDRIRAILDEAGRSDPIERRLVESADDAVRERFLGSPTLRVDGRDVEPGADHRRDYALSCRRYATPDGISGLPTETWLRQALRL